MHPLAAAVLLVLHQSRPAKRVTGISTLLILLLLLLLQGRLFNHSELSSLACCRNCAWLQLMA
jgi:hypothetical protein